MFCTVSNNISFCLFYGSGPKGRKTKTKSTSSASGQSEHESRPCDIAAHVSADSSGCVRQRKFSSKAALNRRRSGSAVSSGTLLSDKKIMDKSDEADDETDDDVCYAKVNESQAANQTSSGNVLHQKLSTITNSPEESKMTGSSSPIRNGINLAFSDGIAPCTLDECDLVNGFTEVTGEIIKDPVRETDKDSGVTTKNDMHSNLETSHILEAAPYQVSGNQACRWGTILPDIDDLSDLVKTCTNTAREPKIVPGECFGKTSTVIIAEAESKPATCTLKKPSSLNLRCTQLKEECIGVSSCDSDGDATTPQTPKVLSCY